MEQYRVLIVDDEAMQRELICEVLRAAPDHFEILEARNGAEAFEILKLQSVDAVLLDKRMPIMDGDELCRQIRSGLGLHMLPLIMVTGTNSTEQLSRSFAAGVDDFIHKPYSPIELLARLKRAVSAKRLTDQLDTAENLMFALARMVEAKDETTGDHCSRLMHMGVAFGQVLGLPERDKDALRRGGILHDIGKLGIPDSILLKASALTADEWVLMRTHTVIGGHLCEGLASMRDVAPIILHHHERWDGSGYPHGLAGEAIPVLARVFQILDIYDALASVRPYKTAMTTGQIIAIFEEETARGWRDPALIRVFLEMLKTNPEQLSLPASHQATADERIFQAIVATGVIDWDRNNKDGAK
jgi:putative two-component system response regulator